MPLFYQHNINDSTSLAVWHITEEEDFFLKKVHIEKEITHPHKRLQHFAGRYLLQALRPDFPFHLIKIAESKKPLLSNGEFHFSISHCGDYAAVIISKGQTVGIDVELVTEKIFKVQNRFLRQEELDLIPGDSARLLTLFWSTKEAIYKWYGKGRASFKNNMGIEKVFFDKDQGIVKAYFVMDTKTALVPEFRFFKDLCLVWVMG